jgi:tetratricopeptide (TPR) repeat protein
MQSECDNKSFLSRDRKGAVALFLLLVGALTVPLYAAADETFDKAEQALGSRDYPAAINLLQQALQSDPDSMRAASEYRQAALRQTVAAHPKEGATADFDKEIAFFQKLTADHSNSANAYLNYGFAYVDKIPAAGSITQVILANNALTQFSKSIDLKPTWIALYTRGNSYLYWPKIFGRAGLGVADLEKAYAIGKSEGKKSYHVRVYVSLGDGYWKTENPDKAKAIWKEGLALFPDSQALKDRLAKQGEDLDKYINDVLDPNKRVDTDLKELWRQQ